MKHKIIEKIVMLLEPQIGIQIESLKDEEINYYIHIMTMGMAREIRHFELHRESKKL